MSIFYQALAPTPIDEVETPTSEDQRDVEMSIKSLLVPYQESFFRHAKATALEPSSIPAARDIPVPLLDKRLHMAFLQKVLEPLPAPYVGFDSTRGWLIYWIFHSHYLMGRELSESFRTRAISNALHFQDRNRGGFGSGTGQIGHLMSTYATIVLLAVVGGPGPGPNDEDVRAGQSTSIGKGGWDDIDRPQMHRFFLSLKQPNGSFTVNKDGETDVRATYCVICVSLLLGIATPQLFEGIGEAIANCQTYEGGISASSNPFQQDDPDGASAGEAHGGYTFCAMASHLMLSLIPHPDTPSISPFHNLNNGSEKEAPAVWQESKSASCSKLDVDSALRWASSQQGIPIEGGGFRGRTNKLVDGCYGWFSGGGLFTVLGGIMKLRHGTWWKDGEDPNPDTEANKEKSSSSGDWESIDDDSLMNYTSDGYLFDRIALQEYILVVAQDLEGGGLRDKPEKGPDAYHTCYNLCGLSMCQNNVQIDLVEMQKHHQSFTPQRKEDESKIDAWRRCCYSAMQCWNHDKEPQCILGGSANQVKAIHPIVNVAFYKVKMMLDWAYDQN